MGEPCEFCAYCAWDEETAENFCLVNLDEDDVYRFHSGMEDACPFFRPDDEYKIVQKQN